MAHVSKEEASKSSRNQSEDGGIIKERETVTGERVESMNKKGNNEVGNSVPCINGPTSLVRSFEQGEAQVIDKDLLPNNKGPTNFTKGHSAMSINNGHPTFNPNEPNTILSPASNFSLQPSSSKIQGDQGEEQNTIPPSQKRPT